MKLRGLYNNGFIREGATYTAFRIERKGSWKYRNNIVCFLRQDEQPNEYGNYSGKTFIYLDECCIREMPKSGQMPIMEIEEDDAPNCFWNGVLCKPVTDIE